MSEQEPGHGVALLLVLVRIGAKVCNQRNAVPAAHLACGWQSRRSAQSRAAQKLPIMKQIFAVVLVALLGQTVLARAAERPSADALPGAGVGAPSIDVPDVGTPTLGDGVIERPRLLTGMYVTSGLLQAYDAYSTIKGTASNHAELNPLMTGLVRHPAMVVAVKVAATAATITIAENLWRTHHRGQAIGVLVASNALLAIVGARNALALRTSR